MPMYQTMWEFMSNHRSEVMVGSNTEGINKVVKDNGKYAYMMESSSIQYIIERNCKVTQIGGNLDTKVKFMSTKIDEIFSVDLTLCGKCHIYGEDFVNFGGLLKKYEL